MFEYLDLPKLGAVYILFQGDCLAEGEFCHQPCSVEREECGHPCGIPCHVGMPCPQVACKAEVRTVYRDIPQC